MSLSPALPTGACVLVFDSQVRPLLVSRPSRPDRLCLPGGKSEAGETLAETAARELREETGVRLSPDELTQVFRGPCPGEGAVAQYDVALFVCTTPIDTAPGSEEDDVQAHFGTLEDLLARSPFAAYNRPALQGAADALASGTSEGTALAQMLAAIRALR